jgi:hypothetical protein
MKKKWKAIPCTHETWKFEKSYERRTDKPIDGYVAIILQTCKNCNTLLGKEIESE